MQKAEELAGKMKGITAEKLAAHLMARPDAKAQHLTAENMMSVVVTLSPRNVPSLGETILIQQGHKISQWGDKAFPMSEKQIAVIAREIADFADGYWFAKEMK